MTQEEKSLWLKDLCARVPYHPKGHIVNVFTGASYDEYLTCATFKDFANVMNNCQLYLRPMSSMTEEEIKQYRKYIFPCPDYDGKPVIGVYNKDLDKIYDWLNANHFDYRGLIDKSLALKAPEGMYNLKEK